VLLALFACGLASVSAAVAQAVVTQTSQGSTLALRSPERADLILRLRSNGRRDPSFDGNGYRRIGTAIRKVYDAERLAHGRVVVVGRPDTGIGVSPLRLAVLRADGTFGRTVTVGRGRYATAHLTALPDGGVIVAGTTVVECPGSHPPTYFGHVFRLTNHLALDPSFGGGDGRRIIVPNTCGEFFPWSAYITSPAAVADDGSVTVGGPSFLARLDAAGNPDPAFGGGDGIAEYAFADAIALQPDGSVAAASVSPEGPFGPDNLNVRRYLADGSTDATFGESGGVTTRALEGDATPPRILADQGNLLTAVADSPCTGPDSVILRFPCESTVTLLRLDGAGQPDPAFGGGDGQSETKVGEAFYGPVDLLDTGENRLVEVGARPSVGGAAFPASVVFAFRPDGELETSFGENGIFRPPTLPSNCGDRGPEGSRLIPGTPEDDPTFKNLGPARIFFHGLTGDDVVDLRRAWNDRYCGGAGNDRLIVRDVDGQRNANQQAFGQGGRDIVSLGEGQDILSGGPGADRLRGGKGRDELYGGSGRDLLRARDGDRDQVHCDKGRDTAFVDRVDRVTSCERVRRR